MYAARAGLSWLVTQCYQELHVPGKILHQTRTRKIQPRRRPQRTVPATTMARQRWISTASAAPPLTNEWSRLLSSPCFSASLTAHLFFLVHSYRAFGSSQGLFDSCSLSLYKKCPGLTLTPLPPEITPLTPLPKHPSVAFCSSTKPLQPKTKSQLTFFSLT